MSSSIKPENGRVIKAVDVETLYSAEGVIERAHQLAQTIEEEARQKAEALIAEADKKAENLIAQERAKAQELIDELHRNEQERATEKVLTEVSDYLKEIRTEINRIDDVILQLVEGSVYKILGSFNKTDLLELVVREGIRDLKDQYGLKLMVHPSQLGVTQDAVSRFRSVSGDAGPIERVEADPKLRPDDCHIVSDGGLLDISVTSQIDRILNGLRTGAMGGAS